MGRAAGENAEADATRAAAARSALLYIIGCRWSLSFYTYKGTRQNRPNVLGKRCLISFPKSPAVTFKKCDLIVFLATPCFDPNWFVLGKKSPLGKNLFLAHEPVRAQIWLKLRPIQGRGGRTTSSSPALL